MVWSLAMYFTKKVGGVFFCLWTLLRNEFLMVDHVGEVAVVASPYYFAFSRFNWPSLQAFKRSVFTPVPEFDLFIEKQTFKTLISLYQKYRYSSFPRIKKADTSDLEFLEIWALVASLCADFLSCKIKSAKYAGNWDSAVNPTYDLFRTQQKNSFQWNT